jgi:hypothetical protein
MLFHTTWRHKPGYTSDDQEQVLKIWAEWTPPKGLKIKSFHMSPDGRGFLITETDDAAAIYEAVAPWSGVLLEYDIVPVIEVDQAVEILKKVMQKG